MTERLDKFEAELKGLRAAPLSAQLSQRISDDLAAEKHQSSRPWSDRLLIFAMSSGALAACVIGAIVLNEMGEQQSAAPVVLATTAAAAPTPRAGDSLMAYAQADVAWARRFGVSN